MSDLVRTTPALETARRRRIELRDALLDTEASISAPAPGRADAWRETALTSLVRLQDAFQAHVESTEAHDGIYDEIEQLAPHLAGKARRLRDEHPPIVAAISSRILRLREADLGSDEQLDDLRDDLQRLLGQIVRHRQHGADLVWLAYMIDIGGAG